MKKTMVYMLVLVVACSMAVSGGTSEAAPLDNPTVTTIHLNGDSADATLSDPDTGTNGFIYVGRDLVGNTTEFDFSYVTPTADPDIIILIQGAGEIPNSAFTTTNTTARLQVVVPYPVIHCSINLVTGAFTCELGDTVAFDLEWIKNGFTTVEEHIIHKETIGPLTVRMVGSYNQRSALVNGTWTGNTAVDTMGNLLDTGGMTVLREITMRMK